MVTRREILTASADIMRKSMYGSRPIETQISNLLRNNKYNLNDSVAIVYCATIIAPMCAWDLSRAVAMIERVVRHAEKVSDHD